MIEYSVAFISINSSVFSGKVIIKTTEFCFSEKGKKQLTPKL